MGYPLVHIVNSTPYAASGEVSYAACKGDNYSADGNGGAWTASHRGLCLVTKITATVAVGSNNVDATPYTSSGTSYSQFCVIQDGNGGFKVTRVISLADNVDLGEMQPESTEQ